MRVNVNIADNVIAKVDEYAEKNGVTRSTAITLLLAQKLAEEELKNKKS